MNINTLLSWVTLAVYDSLMLLSAAVIHLLMNPNHSNTSKCHSVSNIIIIYRHNPYYIIINSFPKPLTKHRIKLPTLSPSKCTSVFFKLISITSKLQKSVFFCFRVIKNTGQNNIFMSEAVNHDWLNIIYHLFSPTQKCSILPHSQVCSGRQGKGNFNQNHVPYLFYCYPCEKHLGQYLECVQLTSEILACLSNFIFQSRSK